MLACTRRKLQQVATAATATPTAATRPTALVPSLSNVCGHTEERAARRPYTSSTDSSNSAEDDDDPLLRVIGQPTGYTHSHLMSPGEVTPGISSEEYAERRRKFGRLLPNDCTVVIPANPTTIMTNDIPYPYHQQVDFLYLCGFNEPGSALVFRKGRRSNSNGSGGGDELEFYMFVTARNAVREMWDGPRAGLDGAAAHFNPDDVFELSDLSSQVQSLSQDSRVIMFHDTHDKSATAALRAELDSSKIATETPRRALHSLRYVKSDAEVGVMKAAAAATAAMFARAMESTATAETEAVVHAALDYGCRAAGGSTLSFPPVVAGGANATILHYVANNQALKQGEILLVDAGAEVHHYCGDVTRSWPVNGEFSDPQRVVYEIVLESQETALAACAPGTSISYIHSVANAVIVNRLREAGLPVQFSDGREAFPHNVGHFLGMDTHDTPLVASTTELVPGAAITVEPGIYFPNDPTIPPEFRNIGIRIEDNVVITADGHINLSTAIPKTVDAVEAALSA